MFENFVVKNVGKSFDISVSKWDLQRLESEISVFDKKTFTNPQIPIVYIKDGFLLIEEKTKKHKNDNKSN